MGRVAGPWEVLDRLVGAPRELVPSPKVGGKAQGRFFRDWALRMHFVVVWFGAPRGSICGAFLESLMCGLVRELAVVLFLWEVAELQRRSLQDPLIVGHTQ